MIFRSHSIGFYFVFVHVAHVEATESAKYLVISMPTEKKRVLLLLVRDAYTSYEIHNTAKLHLNFSETSSSLSRRSLSLSTKSTEVLKKRDYPKLTPWPVNMSVTKTTDENKRCCTVVQMRSPISVVRYGKGNTYFLRGS